MGYLQWKGKRGKNQFANVCICKIAKKTSTLKHLGISFAFL